MKGCHQFTVKVTGYTVSPVTNLSTKREESLIRHAAIRQERLVKQTDRTDEPSENRII